MELYPEISRLTLDDNEKTALFVHFTNKPAQKAEAAAVLSACNDDAARVSYLKALLAAAQPGNDFVTRALET